MAQKAYRVSKHTQAQTTKINIIKISPIGSLSNCSAVAEMGDHLATIKMDRRLRVVPLWGGGAASPSNTMWPGPRPATSMQSFTLIHPTVCPQYINVTDRTDRTGQDNGPIS